MSFSSVKQTELICLLLYRLSTHLVTAQCVVTGLFVQEIGPCVKLTGEAVASIISRPGSYPYMEGSVRRTYGQPSAILPPKKPRLNAGNITA